MTRPSTNHASLLRDPRGMRAFTLAEVLLAMAIFSFALLLMIGMLPSGLSSLKASEQMAAESRIVQYLTATYQLRYDQPGVALTAADSATFNFDARGAPVNAGDPNALYTARVSVMDPLPLPGEASFSPYQRRLQVRISRRMNSNAFNDPSQYHERYLLYTMTQARGAAAAEPSNETDDGSTSTAP